MRDWKQALHLRGHSPRGISHPAFGEQSGAGYMPFPIFLHLLLTRLRVQEFHSSTRTENSHAEPEHAHLLTVG